ncbi:MAG: trypsin-like peptidase domain-containing protein [Lutibacter sp.]|nr:trypsin-like peptidase domain-containing protein [Lutibacter sp.]MDT8417666.1 trypsin-like peptidase domain-containing protein [Lutibacter sp.]
MKKIASMILISALGGAISLGTYVLFFDKPQVQIEKRVDSLLNTIPTNYTNTMYSSTENTDFTVAAERTLNAVVHVKNTMYKTIKDPFAEFFYGEGHGTRQYSQIGTGSGVIITGDGYIVTNNHVIKNATDIEVTLNNRKIYKAKLIGADPISDIALLKIDANNLAYITLGDSDGVQVGEWVLAVGNPFNLTSTVTAGIISAKGRDLSGTSNIDSFLQTDAAVNAGNSGGALVNIHGELVGINTAISSMTGSFIGYSFAIPSNIAKKVIEDLMEFGNVQRAILGVNGVELDNELADKLNIENTNGFYISNVVENSGAHKAGLKTNDVIVKLDNVKISTFSDLNGYISTKKPNDVVDVAFLRNGKMQHANVRLIKQDVAKVSALGLALENLTSAELKKLNIPNGVRIVAITNKELMYYGVQVGYIITSIDDNKVYTIDDVNKMIANKTSGEVMRIEMRNLKGEQERYIFR